MCGRYVLKREDFDAFLKKVGLRSPEEWRSRYNIAPSSVVPVVRRSPPSDSATAASAEVSGLRWGLIPTWSKPDAPVKPLVNVRADTLLTRFRGALRSRRCVLPASGFFEWETVGPIKRPWFFQPHDSQPMGFAGIWDAWRLTDGTALETCTILTTSPNAVLSPIHDRMPVILTAAQIGAWLETPADDTAALERLLAPAPDDALAASRVSAAVNSVRNDGPECLAPATEEPDGDGGGQLELL